MKAIMISIKPKWCAKIMNGEKTIEVRKNKYLAKAIKNLIDENGFADIYVYCSKSNYLGYISNRYVGKVVFKFRCYFAELLPYYFNEDNVCEKSCLTFVELRNYLKDNNCCAIHINDLEIFDKPKELSEFYTLKCDQKEEPCNIKDVFGVEACYNLCKKCKPFTKAPQNFYYTEVE